MAEPISPTSPSSPEVADLDSAAAAAKAKREARKAKILGRGTDRLARITKTGRGEEAEALYSSSEPATRSTAASLAAGTSTDDPDEVDISALPPVARTIAQEDRMGPSPDMEAMMRMLGARMGGEPGDDIDGGPFGMGQEGPGGQQDPLQAMMAAMQQQQMGTGGVGAEGGPQDPMAAMMAAMQQRMSGQGGGFGGGLPAQLMAALGNGPEGAPGSGLSINGQAVERTERTTADRIFDALHAALMIALGVFVATAALRRSSLGDAAAEPSSPLDAAIAQPTARTLSSLERWGMLGYHKPAEWEGPLYALESVGLPVNLDGVPVFWLFISLEVMLQSTRIMLFKNRPPPSSLLYKISSFVPPSFGSMQLLLQTAARYWALLSTIFNDLALLVFTVGIAILLASWQSGAGPAGFDSPLGFGGQVPTGTDPVTNMPPSRPL